MSREVRRVPANWDHPMTVNYGRYEHRSMHQQDWAEVYAEWQRDLGRWYECEALWREGTFRDYEWDSDKFTDVPVAEEIARYREFLNDPKYANDTGQDWIDGRARFARPETVAYSDRGGGPPSPPNPERYMPTGGWWQLFQTVSEGTPVTPPFETAEELVQYLVTYGTDEGRPYGPWPEDRARAMVDVGWVPSGVIVGGRVYTNEETLDLK